MIKPKISSKFKRPFILRRYAAGSYVDGIWVDGVATDTTEVASIQPLTAGDYRLLPEGNSGQLGWKLFWSQDFQFGDDGVLKPDRVQVDGVWFKMASKEGWIANGHSAAAFIEIKS